MASSSCFTSQDKLIRTDLINVAFKPGEELKVVTALNLDDIEKRLLLLPLIGSCIVLCLHNPSFDVLFIVDRANTNVAAGGDACRRDTVTLELKEKGRHTILDPMVALLLTSYCLFM